MCVNGRHAMRIDIRRRLYGLCLGVCTYVCMYAWRRPCWCACSTSQQGVANASQQWLSETAKSTHTHTHKLTRELRREHKKKERGTALTFLHNELVCVK